MQASYRGYEDGPKVVRHADITFRRGVFVNVPDHVAKKLGGNRFFEVKAGEAPPAPEPEPELTAEPTEEPGSEDERVTVMAKLDALGADYDGRWGLPRLKAALEAAEFEKGAD